MNQHDFVRLLKKHNELLEINAPVSTELEITEITDRISKSESHNKALLFLNNGTAFPLLINSFGSEKRIALALHSQTLQEVENKIEQIFSLLNPPTNFSEKVKIFGKAFQLSSYLPKYKNKKGVCQEIVHLNPDLNILPILKCWEHDGGKFITLPMVHTYLTDKKQLNVGMYRMQVFSQNSTGMHWHIHKTGALHYAESKNKIPVAVCLGGDPVYTYCATAPLPHGINEYILAGILRKKAVTLIPCITQKIFVPEDVDIVLEGYIDTQEPLQIEGPFGDHTGFYSLPDKYPIFHITAITHKKNAIYPATIVGIPPQEDFWLIKASERIFLQFLKHTLLHEIIDMNMPPYGVAHNLVIVQIKTQYPKHANKIAHALWGIGQMMLNKILIVTDKAIDNSLFSYLASIRWKDKLLLSYGPMDALEHAGLKPLEGGKLMLDCTNIENNNNTTNNRIIECIEKFFISSTVYNVATAYNIFIVFTNHYKQYDYQQLLKHISDNSFTDEVRLFLLQYELHSMNLKDWAWHFLANFDPSTDFQIFSHNNLDLLVFDGRIKPHKLKSIPNPTISPQHIIDIVNQRWNEYFDIPFISSPSEKYKNLFYGKSYFVNE